MVMKKNSKKIIFNHFTIEVFVFPDDGKDHTISCCGDEATLDGTTAGMCCEGDRNKPFALMFRRGGDPTVVAHEVWHLFFKILRHMTGNDHEEYVTYGDMESEIYAYRFSDLFDLVTDTLKGL